MNKTKDETSVEEWLDTIDPATTPARDGLQLREVGQALTALETAERELERAVSSAREAGDSWAAISAVLGTSRQAAHRKFAKVGQRRSNDLHERNREACAIRDSNPEPAD